MSSILAGAKKMRVMDVIIVLAIVAAVILAVRMLVLYKDGGARFDGFAEGEAGETSAGAGAGATAVAVPKIPMMDSIHKKNTGAEPFNEGATEQHKKLTDKQQFAQYQVKENLRQSAVLRKNGATR
jgi:Na+/glutamate symporter